MIRNDRTAFEGKVDRNGPIPAHCPELGPCHVWTAYCSPDGYGRFRFLGKQEQAHRVSFFFAHGRWPEPCGLHRCDNRACVNDAHLYEGDRPENNADRDAKGRLVNPRGERHGSRTKPERAARGVRHGRHTKPHRTARGERIHGAKLTEQNVRDIRAEYALRRVTQPELARRHGVTRATISKIVLRRIWAHV